MKPMKRVIEIQDVGSYGGINGGIKFVLKITPVGKEPYWEYIEVSQQRAMELALKLIFECNYQQIKEQQR